MAKIDAQLTGLQLQQIHREIIDFLKVYLELLAGIAMFFGRWHSLVFPSCCNLKYVGWKSSYPKWHEYGQMVNLERFPFGSLIIDVDQLFNSPAFYLPLKIPGIHVKPARFTNMNILFFAMKGGPYSKLEDVLKNTVEICPYPVGDVDKTKYLSVIPDGYELLTQIIIKSPSILTTWAFSMETALNDRLTVINPLLATPITLPVYDTNIHLPDRDAIYWQTGKNAEERNYQNEVLKPLKEYRIQTEMKLKEILQEANRRISQEKNGSETENEAGKEDGKKRRGRGKSRPGRQPAYTNKEKTEILRQWSASKSKGEKRAFFLDSLSRDEGKPVKEIGRLLAAAERANRRKK